MVRHLIRGATLEDEKDLCDLAHHLNTVNLPDDPAAVREILDLSVKSFSGALKRDVCPYPARTRPAETARIPPARAYVGA